MSSKPSSNQDPGDGGQTPKLSKTQQKRANRKANKAAQQATTTIPQPSSVPANVATADQSPPILTGPADDEEGKESELPSHETKPDATGQDATGTDTSGTNADDGSTKGTATPAPDAPRDMSEISSARYDIRTTHKVGSTVSLQYPQRPKFGSSNHVVLTNHFNIRLEESKKQKKDEHCLFEYRISNIDHNHTRAKKRKLIEAAVEQCRALQNSQDYWVTDNMEKVVSWINLCNFDANIPENPTCDVPLDTFQVDDYNRSNYSMTTLSLDLEFVRKIDLKDLVKYVNGGNNNVPEKQQAIAAANLFFTKHLFTSAQGDLQGGRNRFFNEDWFDSFDSPGKLAYRGYTFQVRPAMGRLMLNINTSTSLFYSKWTVADYLEGKGNRQEDLLGVRVRIKFRRNPDQLSTDAHGNEINLDTEQARTKTISEFGSRANQQLAYSTTDQDGTIVNHSVWDHMQRYLGKDGEDKNSAGSGNSLCVNTNPLSAATKTWFLAEDLVIVPHQMCKPKLDARLTSSMIKKACRKPAENASRILNEGLKAIGGWENQKQKDRPESFRNFGISIDPRMLKVPARTVTFPQLAFSSGQPGDVYKGDYLMYGQWQLVPGIKFLTQTQNISGDPFFLVPSKYADKQVPYFSQTFWKYYTAHGAPSMGKLPARFDHTISRAKGKWTRLDFEAAQAIAAQNSASIVILILPRDNKENLLQYADFKAVMDQSGMDSLCLCEEKIVERYTKSNPESPTSHIANYAYNVGMKLNIRLGNTNHSLDKTHLDILPTKDTLILGADVIHPGATSIDGTPSIAALVGSVDENYGKYLGSMGMQKYDSTAASKEIIDDEKMRSLARERLQAWKKVNGRFPCNILYYHDGVSESQFDDVLHREVKMVRAAYQDVASGTEQAGAEPKITAVVVVKRHNVRLYPSTNDETRMSGTGNCLPGTVVDSGITHPYNFDFFLISHDGLQGTARPTHYIVLANQIGFSAEEIQDLTHNLCYTYQRSTTSVSYAPPAYYADHLCERGRCYLMDFYNGDPKVYDPNPDVVEQNAKNVWESVGRAGGNPWHPNMDDKMFWM